MLKKAIKSPRELVKQNITLAELDQGRGHAALEQKQTDFSPWYLEILRRGKQTCGMILHQTQSPSFIIM